MRLLQARIRHYRSIKDTGWFDVDRLKTILVGPNEAGKTVILQALQQLNPPTGVKRFEPLRDYPRSLYNKISTGEVKPGDTIVVSGKFSIDDDDVAEIGDEFKGCTYTYHRRLDNSALHSIEGAPDYPEYSQIKKKLIRLCNHCDSRIQEENENNIAKEEAKPADQRKTVSPITSATDQLKSIELNLGNSPTMDETNSQVLLTWLEKIYTYIDEENSSEERRYEDIVDSLQVAAKRNVALAKLDKGRPVFVLFNNYYRVRPRIHLAHLAERLNTNILDDDQYDYGNSCLLKLLGFTAKELSDLGNPTPPADHDSAAVQEYQDNIDKRTYQLNAASVHLTEEITSIWKPDKSRDEAARLRIQADGQYLKVVVEDELGVEVELDQRSEGFQWLVSFFVVFFAEARSKYKNAILLLDEPGINLHGLKQREFRQTISRLAESNQVIYTTHSPFLVGPDELDIVRVVEMTDRKVGTKIHTTISAGDSAGLLPLQEALGYDLAQSLFAQQRNLVVEGLTDYWYIESVSELANASNGDSLNSKIALVIASTAGKVVYFATILFAHNLKVAALLDSDSAGDRAAEQDTLVHTLGNKNILRTKDSYGGDVGKPEIEDLLRETLVQVGKDECGWDVEAIATSQPSRPIVDIFSEVAKDFSKYKLAKAFLRWSRSHTYEELSATEREQWAKLFAVVNKALK